MYGLAVNLIMSVSRHWLLMRCGANNGLHNVLTLKELKSCMGVLLRADLTGHSQFSQSANFCQKGWDGRALLGQPSKGHPCRILICFPYCSTIPLAPHIKILETYFALFIFLDFRTVWYPCFHFGLLLFLSKSSNFKHLYIKLKKPALFYC